MNVGWQIRPLGDLCDVLDSKRKPITKSDRIAGEYPYYGASGILDHVAGYIFTEKLILIGEDGAKWAAGERTAFAADGKFWVNNHAHVIRPRRNVVTDDWLIYFLNWSDLSPFITGLTVPKLNQEKMRTIPVPVPPLHEQKRIVAILDEAFEGINTAIANTEKNFCSAGDLFNAYLSSFLAERGTGWPCQKLGEFAEVQSGGTPTVSQKEYWGGGIPWYSSGELNETYTSMPERTISKQGLDTSNAKLFPSGSLLVGMYDTAALKMSILDRDAAFNQAIAGVKPSDTFDARFLLYSILVRKPALLLERRGVRQKNLSLTKIKDIIIPLPQMFEQVETVGKISSVFAETQRLRNGYSGKLRRLAELKQSILQRAFAGELTTRSAADTLEAAE